MNRTSLWEIKERMKGTRRLVVASCRFMVVVRRFWVDEGGSGGKSDW